MKKSDIKTGDYVVLGNRPVYQGHKHYGKTFKEASSNGIWESKHPHKKNPFKREWLKVIKMNPLTVRLNLPKKKGRVMPKGYRNMVFYTYWVTEHKKKPVPPWKEEGEINDCNN